MSKKQYDETNRGTLWKNDRKQSDTHPDLSGTINVDGKEYWLSGWRGKGADGGKGPILSLSVKPKEAKPERAQQARREAFEDVDTRHKPSDFGDDQDWGF
jgi:hypothetical protein